MLVGKGLGGGLAGLDGKCQELLFGSLRLQIIDIGVRETLRRTIQK
jgi:hypothetical protein